MGKANASITVQADLWERFKRETGNASDNLEDYIRNYLQHQNSDLQKRKEALDDEIGEIEEEILELESRKSNLEAEAQAIQAEIEREEEAQEDEQLQKAIKILKRKREEKPKRWKDSQAIKFWSSQLAMTAQELSQKVKESDLDKKGVEKID